ncbi:MAG TPA: NAD(P)/FAD-dependent oxidoreductase [Kofleriaceae bacterium]|nr:NAD(P)/FAD-dependent oxidoreductase [Kofleriaceae bacterium]
MSAASYDVIVVGARCAGAPTAMLLARKGYRVLVVDRATFPSDTISTHLVHPPGIAILARWGLLDRLIATGCPAIDTYVMDFGPFAITGSPAIPGAPAAYCPRRTVLDKLLVDAAREAGAEVREGFSVEEIVVEGGRVTGIRGHGQDGVPLTASAPVVVGADGRHSLVARAVAPASYHEKPPLLCGYYSYWRGLPMHGRFETYILPLRGVAAMPTHDDLTLVIAGWPYAEFEAQKQDLEASYHATIDQAPSFGARARGATRVDKIYGAAVPNYFRTPYGPGWALIGDAGYNKDPITAQGISDAFRHAELLVAGLHASFTGAQAFEDAMEGYRRTRDEHAMGIYELTTQLATLEPPPPELQQLLGAIHGHRPAMDAFIRMNAGALSPADFFATAGAPG